MIVKSIKRKSLESILAKRGCTIIRTTGGHDIWQCGSCQAPVPRHNEIAADTLRSIDKLLTPCLGEGWLNR
jgi:hypothetical protein